MNWKDLFLSSARYLSLSVIVAQRSWPKDGKEDGIMKTIEDTYAPLGAIL